MNFSDMIKELQKGEYMTRPSFGEHYLMMPYGVNKLVIVNYTPGIEFDLVFYMFCPSEDDLVAEDWQVV